MALLTLVYKSVVVLLNSFESHMGRLKQNFKVMFKQKKKKLLKEHLELEKTFIEKFIILYGI